MNIYFSCSLTGGRKDEATYGAIVAHLVARGHEVPTAHLADPGVMALERVVDPAEVYARDMDWIRRCDALVAEVSTPSHGVGYEIAAALGLGKPVLSLYRDGAAVSKMLTGNDSPGFRALRYLTVDEALTAVDRFLEAIGR
ncbi:MAG TPA: nucleoside 2-deoxyribosyltransferase [Anaerolineales bacterium]|nr:nucleoside 2-deoxyribosyltransferase [Anaerolineales bacterium]